jgi:phosphohistidine swiveling domain-containing protein
MVNTQGFNPQTGEWNDSLTGDYLWSNVNFGEAVTEAMTPLTWSVIQFTLDDWVFIPGFPTVGNIGGRPYLNISIFATLFNGLRRSRQDLLDYMEATLYMPLPGDMEIPLVPLSRWELLSSLPAIVQVQAKQWRGIKAQKSYLETNQAWFKRIRKRIQVEESKSQLKALWVEEIKPHIKFGVWCVLGSATYSANYTMQLRRDLSQLVGPDDANILVANLSKTNQYLESIGPIVGMGRVARGEMSMNAYLEQYGHRGPQEFELSVPRPAEDTRWFNDELVKFHEAPFDIDALLTKQSKKFDDAWERISSRYPVKVKVIRRRLAESAQRARSRELARSEYTRDRWIIRLFALRAAYLTGLGEDIFFLSLDEVLNLLDGNQIAISDISIRKETYKRYKSLPPYPSVIRGQFKPFEWAADPKRRIDIFDSISRLEPNSSEHEQSRIISGSPGSAGRVEGPVRHLEGPEQGDLLQAGEILLAVQTDIAWTLLFPRAAAVVTDVGAPLSHAAIVARELGIPAVVGCGDATARLKTGDRVLVDGGRGIVEILDQKM